MSRFRDFREARTQAKSSNLKGLDNTRASAESASLSRSPKAPTSSRLLLKQMKNHWRKYKLSKVDQDKSESFVQDGKIDKKKLHEQFTKLEPKIKAEWKVSTTGVAFPKLQEWADTLNIHANEKKPVQFGNEVQLFRYFAGCGASTEWNPKGGKLGGKVDGSAEIALAHGEAKVSGYLPGPEGWAWSLTGVKTGTPRTNNLATIYICHG